MVRIQDECAVWQIDGHSNSSCIILWLTVVLLSSLHVSNGNRPDFLILSLLLLFVCPLPWVLTFEAVSQVGISCSIYSLDVRLYCQPRPAPCGHTHLLHLKRSLLVRFKVLFELLSRARWSADKEDRLDSNFFQGLHKFHDRALQGQWFELILWHMQITCGANTFSPLTVFPWLKPGNFWTKWKQCVGHQNRCKIRLLRS